MKFWLEIYYKVLFRFSQKAAINLVKSRWLINYQLGVCSWWWWWR